MRTADERPAKRITRVVHVASAKRIPISQRGNGQHGQGKSLGILGKPDVPPSSLIPYISSTRRWTQLRNFLIATKVVQRKRSVVRFLPFGCIGYFTLLQQLFSEYLDIVCRAGMLRDTHPAHKSNEIDAFNSHVLHILSLTPRLHRLINISP